MNFSRKNFLLIIFIILLNSGCLVPGAPQHFLFTDNVDKGDSAIVISFPNMVDYHYFSSQEYDSLFVFDSRLSTYKKMKRNGDRIYSYESNEKLFNANLRRIKKTKFMYFQKFNSTRMSLDTLKQSAQKL